MLDPTTDPRMARMRQRAANVRERSQSAHYKLRPDFKEAADDLQWAVDAIEQLTLERNDWKLRRNIERGQRDTAEDKFRIAASRLAQIRTLATDPSHAIQMLQQIAELAKWDDDLSDV